MDPKKSTQLTLCTWQGQPYPLKYHLLEWAARGHLIIHSSNNEVWVSLTGPIGQLADMLEQLATEARREANRYHSPEGLKAANGHK